MDNLSNYNLLKQKIDNDLQIFINEEKNQKFKEIINYIFIGGKRIRPIIVNIVFNKYIKEFNILYTKKNNKIEFCNIIPEIIHNISLVMDDLPCMDNDNYRRNKKSTHFNFGEIPSYFSILKIFNNIFIKFRSEIELSKKFKLKHLDGVIKYLNCREFFNNLVIENMEKLIEGQYYDLSFTDIDLDLDILYKINSKKTGPLFSLSFILGYIQIIFLKEDFLIEEIIINQLNEIGNIFGLIFQLNDDIIDRDEDKKNGKNLNLSLCLGLKKSINIFNLKCQDLKNRLSNLNLWDIHFEEIIELLKKRI
tara:strand:+ start:21422 stop:22342 length:921 start_codon:yes stop_codon:yes gene_type:complete